MKGFYNMKDTLYGLEPSNKNVQLVDKEDEYIGVQVDLGFGMVKPTTKYKKDEAGDVYVEGMLMEKTGVTLYYILHSKEVFDEEITNDKVTRAIYSMVD